MLKIWQGDTRVLQPSVAEAIYDRSCLSSLRTRERRGARAAGSKRAPAHPPTPARSMARQGGKAQGADEGPRVHRGPRGRDLDTRAADEWRKNGGESALTIRPGGSVGTPASWSGTTKLWLNRPATTSLRRPLPARWCNQSSTGRSSPRVLPPASRPPPVPPGGRAGPQSRRGGEPIWRPRRPHPPPQQQWRNRRPSSPRVGRRQPATCGGAAQANVRWPNT